jgi:hypothetical protein
MIYLGLIERRAYVEEVWSSGPSKVVTAENGSFYVRVLPKKSVVGREVLPDGA